MTDKKNARTSSSKSNIRRYQSLDQVRKRIDEVDAEIARLLAERLALASEVAALKIDLNISIKDGAREQEVLDRVTTAASDAHICAAIREIYQTIFACSRQLQRIDAARACAMEAPVYFPQITIVGLGLIGGTLARLVRETVPETRIIAVDSDADALNQAVEEGIINRGEADLRKAIARSALVILAATPEANMQLLSEMAPHLSKRQLVIDVTSIKSPIVEAAEQAKLKADFIGGHPMFGSERSGFEASQAVQADGAVFCLTPAGRSSEISLRRLIRWLGALNLKAHVIEAAQHDKVLARTSHAVQLLAVAVGSGLADLCEQAGRDTVSSLCGTSMRQLSRLMS
ncbi:MAG: prephenate dehydrogenase/arogenate dehydrogenase family protein, partial [Terriglobales bacterium]